MRILVTGSRTWTDRWAIYHALRDVIVEASNAVPNVKHAPGPFGLGELILVHGGARGADSLADELARRNIQGMQVEVHPADWERYGKRAGFLRNDAMVNQGADVCLAFIKDASKGATMCADIAEAAGIPTKRFTA